MNRRFITNNFVITVMWLAFAIIPTGTAAATGLFKDEVVLKGTEIVGLIQSSKESLQHWYLFVVRADSLKVSPRDGADASELVEALPQPALVEVMAPRTTCYGEVMAAASWDQGQLILSKMQMTVLAPTPEDPGHDWFLKLEPLGQDGRDRAQCEFFKSGGSRD